jgi:hypothetical protein
MLSGQTSDATLAIPLACRTVTNLATLEVAVDTALQVLTIPNEWRSSGLKLSDESCNVDEVLWGGEHLHSRHMLHTNIPARGVTIINELSQQHGIVLTRNDRSRALGGACAIDTVTSGAGCENTFTPTLVGR